MNKWVIHYKSEMILYFSTTGIGHGNIPPIPRIGEFVRMTDGKYHIVRTVQYDYTDSDNTVIEVIVI